MKSRWRIPALILCLSVAAGLAPAQAQDAADTQQTSLRYLDVTARNDGWIAAQDLAIIGSRDHRIVLISYADPQTTRAIYDLAVSYTKPPYNLPIFGVSRAPQHPTEPNANGFDIYINGLPLGAVPNPEPRVSNVQHLSQLLKFVAEDYRTGKLGGER